MRRLLLILSIAAGFFAFSCQKEGADIGAQREVTESRPFKFAIDAVIPDLEESESRGTAGSFMGPKWTEGDELSVINMTTGRLLSGKLRSAASGTTSRFEGEITSGISVGDKIAFLYPAQDNTAEKNFTSATVSFAHQTNGSSVQLCAYGTMTASGAALSTATINFSLFMTFYKFNLANLPTSTPVTQVEIGDVADELTININGDRNGLTATPNSSDRTIIIDGFDSTTASGHLAVRASAIASDAKAGRSMKVYTEDKEFTSTISGDAIQSGRYYNEIVSGFDKISFADPEVESYCVENFDLNGDGKVSFTEALAVESFPTQETKASYGVLPNTITSFMELQFFTNITTLPSFAGFSSLVSISIPSSVTTVPENCFNGCTGLKKVYFRSEAAPSIGAGAFDSLAGLTIYVPDGQVEAYAAKLPAGLAGKVKSVRDEDIISIDDSIFKAYCVSHFDSDGDGEISRGEAASVTSIDIYPSHISSLKGLEFFTNLTSLFCYGNQLTSLDVSKNTKLFELRCYRNQLSSLDISKNTDLQYLACYNNQLSSLDVSKNTELEFMICSSNRLSSLDVSKNTKLVELDCYNNRLSSLDVSDNTELRYLYCSPMNDANGANLLQYLYVAANQTITGITSERSEDNIPAGTQIVDRANNPDGNEGVDETEGEW